MGSARSLKINNKRILKFHSEFPPKRILREKKWRCFSPDILYKCGERVLKRGPKKTLQVAMVFRALFSQAK